MGYYTSYSLQIEDATEQQLQDIHAYLVNDESFEALDRSVMSNRYGEADTAKWYEHDEDMGLLARQFPQCLFLLSGEGEESGDLWIKYYRGDKMQEAGACISYDPPTI